MNNINTDAVLNMEDCVGGVELFEMCIAVITIFFCLLLMIMLMKNYPYHVHLWVLVINLVVIIASYTMLRLIIIVITFYKPNPKQLSFHWLHMVRHSTIYSEAYAILAIVIERSVAAKFSRKYEKSKQYRICALVVSISWVLPALLTLSSLYFDVVPYFVLLGILIALCLSSIIIMISLKFQVNRRRKERFQKWAKTADITNNELSKQYQLKENIRSSKFLLPLILILTTSAIIAVTLLTLKTYCSLSPKIFNFVLAIRALSLPIFIARAHSVFRRQLVLLIQTASNLVSSSDGEVPASRAARSGQVYAVSNVASMEMHFASLHDAWEHYDPNQQSRQNRQVSPA